MPHIYPDAAKLQAKPKVGQGDCVELVQHHTPVGWTGRWRPWVRVLDAGFIRVGTVIATFSKRGHYPNRATGNHAAFFMGMGPLDPKTGRPSYIVVMDQWKKKAISPNAKFMRSENQKRKEAAMMTRIMLKHFGWWSSLGGLAFVAQTAVAASIQLQCPSQYPNEKQLSILRAAGWQPVSPGVRHGLLMEAGVLLGSPSDNGVLRGADLRNIAGREFHFYGSDQDREKWVYCDYGMAPGGRLAYSLAVQITRCESKEITARKRLVQAHFRCN